MKRPKFPPFEGLKDNIDAYIQRFEIYAISQKWHKDTCEVHLSDSREKHWVFSHVRHLKQNLIFVNWKMTEDGFRKNFVFQNQMEVKFLCNSLQVWTVISNDGSIYRRLTELLKIWMTYSCMNSFFCVAQKIGIILQWEDLGVDSRYDAIYIPICRGKNYDFLIVHTETDFRRKTNKRNTNIQYNRTKAVTVWSYECGKYGHKWLNCNYW